VSSSTQGMLVPRLALTSTTSQSPIIATPANSLLVYNTATTGDVTPGYYYWDTAAAKWTRIASGSGSTPCSGAPSTPGPIIGASVVGQGTTVTYMVAPVANATTYTWSYTGTGATMSGTTNPVSIYFSPTATSGDLTVTASCGNGNSTSAAYTITIPHGTLTFAYTGAIQTWVVPVGVYSVTIDAFGAQGCQGGKGGEAKGTLAVQPLQVLYIYVGQCPSNGTGGWNGGGNGTGYCGGGGASDVRMYYTDLAYRIIVAAGGGGGGWNNGVYTAGGNGGGTSGTAGSTNSYQYGGSGATQSSGGAGGSGSYTGGAGTLGQGGSSGAYGNGGGGGYYGGGGGGGNNSSPSYGGGGGGGSSWISSSLTSQTNSANVRTGNGQIIFTW